VPPALQTLSFPPQLAPAAPRPPARAAAAAAPPTGAAAAAAAVGGLTMHLHTVRLRLPAAAAPSAAAAAALGAARCVVGLPAALPGALSPAAGGGGDVPRCWGLLLHAEVDPGLPPFPVWLQGAGDDAPLLVRGLGGLWWKAPRLQLGDQRQCRRVNYRNHPGVCNHGEAVLLELERRRGAGLTARQPSPGRDR
jgi:hypothetical protein